VSDLAPALEARAQKRPLAQRPLPWGPLVALLSLAAVAAGVWGYACQLDQGLGVTGLGQPVFWGVYIINFVFFIGIAHAGTLVSAVLRLIGADWCRPLCRLAEVGTVICLAIGTLQILIDVGRPDRAPWFFLRDGRFQSPLLWDATCIVAYFSASLLYLYLPLLPDLAARRDRGGRGSTFYAILAGNWQGTPAQWHLLHRAMAVMAVLIVPVAVSVHSVISFIFATTLQPGWHSTIFAPYFVVGAVFSGVAAILLLMATQYRRPELAGAITEDHFRRLGRLLLVLSLVWFYFTVAEHITVGYGGPALERQLAESKLSGPYAPAFWLMVALNLGLPLLCLCRLQRRPVLKSVIASLGVVVGMWLERYLIVVPTLLTPRLALPQAAYQPSGVELAVSLGSLGLFGLAFLAFAALFPLVPQWQRPAAEAATGAASREVRVPLAAGWRGIRLAQTGLIAMFALFLIGVMVWLGRLTLVAFTLQDAPAFAVGLTLVMLPVYSLLLAVGLKVLLGVWRGDG